MELSLSHKYITFIMYLNISPVGRVFPKSEVGIGW